MAKNKKLIHAIIASIICCVCVIPIVSPALATEIKKEEFFSNPLPEKMLKRLETISEDTAFVLENYFICDETNNTEHIKSKHKIKLEGDFLARVKSILQSQKEDIERQKTFWKPFKNLAPIDSEERTKTFGYGMRCLENNRDAAEELLYEIFRPVLKFDFSDYDNNLRDPNEDTYINYLFNLRNRLRQFQNLLMETYAISEMYYNGEIAMEMFEKKGFILKGNATLRPEASPFAEITEASRKLNFIKRNGTPFTDEEMANLTPADFGNTDQENPPKVKWFPLTFNNIEFIGAIFRDIPDFESPSGFEEVVEFYFLGQINDLMEKIMFDKVVNGYPMEIRWTNDTGERLIAWSPYFIYPLDFQPIASNSLYQFTK